MFITNKFLGSKLFKKKTNHVITFNLKTTGFNYLQCRVKITNLDHTRIYIQLPGYYVF